MTSSRIVAVVAFVVATGSSVWTQTSPPPARLGPPIREDPWTATVEGVVTAAETGAPVPGAEVRLNGSGRHRLTMTDADGRFAFTDLPAERVTLHASKAGYVSAAYGQRHPLEEAVPIDPAPGERVIADVSLSPGGALYGRVFDELGEPAAGALVRALRAGVFRGQPTLQRVGDSDQTDDTGAFRLYGLPPGTYYLSAQPGPAGSEHRAAPTWYPGTASKAASLPIDLDRGRQVPVSIALTRTSLARVSGIVLDETGAPAEATLSLSSDSVVVGLGPDDGAEREAGVFTITGNSGSDGRFSLTDVPPGPYVLTATIRRPGAIPVGLATVTPRTPEEAQQQREALARAFGGLTASQPVLVSGEDVPGLTLLARPAALLRGRVVAATGASRPAVAVSVQARSHGGPSQFRMSSGPGSVTGPDGMAFFIPAPTGPFSLDVSGFPSLPLVSRGWAVSAILLDGRDVTDELIEVTSDADVEVVLTDRVTTVTGVVRADRADDSAAARVVIFASDDAHWAYPSRYVRATRADAAGRFEIAGLPPGERYLAVAVDYLVAEEEYDAAFLESVRRQATGFTLDDEGDQRTLRLDLVER